MDEQTKAGKWMGRVYLGMISVGVESSHAQMIIALIMNFGSQQNSRADVLGDLLKKVIKVYGEEEKGS